MSLSEKYSLSSAQKEKASREIQRRTGGTPICPMCGHNDWFIADHMVNAPVFTGQGMVVGGDLPVYPFVMLVCKTCVHVSHFMALPLGIMEEASEDDG